MSEVADIASRVREIVADQLRHFIGEIGDAESLSEKGGMDSLDQAEITMMVEDEFGIYIDDDVMLSFDTIQQIVDHVAMKV